MKTRFLLTFFLSFVVLLTACQQGSDTPATAESQAGEADAVTTIDDYPMLPLSRLMAPATYLVPQVSPDGQWVSWIGPLDGTPNLFVAPVDDLEAARPVTKFTDAGVRPTDISGQVMYRWHFDSRHIIYPKDYEGDENWDIHVVNIETGEDRNLTPLPDKSVKVIAHGRNHPDEVLISIETFGKFDPDIYRLNFSTGERSLVQQNQGMLAYLADNELNIRLGVAFAADGGLEFFRYHDGQLGDLFYRVTADDMPALVSSIYQQIIRFSADNTKLYLYDAQERDKAALVALDMDSGELEVLAEDDRVDISGVIYAPVSSEVQGYATNWTRTTWTALDDAIADDIERLGGIDDGDWKILSRSDDDSVWVVQYMASDEPIVFYLYRPADGGSQRMFTSTPQLEGLKLSPMHPYVLTTEDGFDLVSYVVLPPWTDPDEDGRPDEPVPVVVLVHGGPSDERAVYAFAPFVHWLANRGYGMLYVNFRGSAGFGKAYMNAQRMEWGGKMHQDILDQVRWAIEEGIAIPDKVAILGGSYGGYAALVGMTMTPDVFACGVDVVGPSNLEIFMPHWDEDRMGKVIGDPRTEEGRAFLRSRSPINFAHQTKNPVLIAQGANDSRVPQEQSDIVVEKMQEAGAEVTYIVYPDEGHGFLRPANSMSFNAITEVFLGECLDGRYEPIGDNIEGSSVEVPVGVEHIPGLAEALAARTDTGMPDQTVADVAAEVVARYAGTYLLEQYGVEIPLRMDGDKLMFEMPGQPVSQLFPSSETEFFFKVAPTTVTFFMNDDGSVSHMIMNSQGTETRVERVK
ncbi:MAG: prolyl oligopeptidase family serine peptidase [Xanthomonadales bacterium]|jgi:dipeptidyl aminopeptidase/acylaminoacyl peptidase|nr:prolyl oligopeptidase family serine peptidase [Xanthomonadales bacterium]